MEKYIEIAKKFLSVDVKHLPKGLCFSIRKQDLDNSENPEELIKEKLNSICYEFSSAKKYTDNYGMDYLLFYNKSEENGKGREYEAIEDILTEKISWDIVSNIEDFIGYSISAEVLENLEDRIREVLDQMSEEEMFLYEEKYALR